MLLEPRQDSDPKADQTTSTAEVDKIRLRFRKFGDLRLISHHDLMQSFERLFRRAAIPFRCTQGFHPTPRMVFAQPLALGIIGHEEVLEVELIELLDTAEIHERLAQHAPPGLEILSVRRIPRKSHAEPYRVAYRAPLPPERRAAAVQSIDELLRSTECWIERQRPKARRLNLRPYLCDLRLVDGCVVFSLWVSPNGMARPGEVLEALGLDDLLLDGLILERIRIELVDESDGTDCRLPEIPQPGSTAPCATPRQERPTSLLPGPLSFDS